MMIIIELNISSVQVARMQYINKIFQSEVLTIFTWRLSRRIGWYNWYWLELCLTTKNSHSFPPISWWKNKEVKGFHSFLKLNIKNICNETGLIDKILDTNYVKVFLIGAFTKKQRKRIFKRCDINLGRVVRLLKWLPVNNHFYPPFTFPEIDTLPLPQIEIVDESDEADSENDNAELTEDFKVVFLEGDMSK